MFTQLASLTLYFRTGGEGGPVRAIPAAARVYILCAVLCAAACALPARAGAATGAPCLLLAGLYAVCELARPLPLCRELRAGGRRFLLPRAARRGVSAAARRGRARRRARRAAGAGRPAPGRRAADLARRAARAARPGARRRRTLCLGGARTPARAGLSVRAAARRGRGARLLPGADRPRRRHTRRRGTGAITRRLARAAAALPRRRTVCTGSPG